MLLPSEALGHSSCVPGFLVPDLRVAEGQGSGPNNMRFWTSEAMSQQTQCGQCLRREPEGEPGARVSTCCIRVYRLRRDSSARSVSSSDTNGILPRIDLLESLSLPAPTQN
jgi:hypothetical protein